MLLRHHRETSILVAVKDSKERYIHGFFGPGLFLNTCRSPLPNFIIMSCDGCRITKTLPHILRMIMERNWDAPKRRRHKMKSVIPALFRSIMIHCVISSIITSVASRLATTYVFIMCLKKMNFAWYLLLCVFPIFSATQMSQNDVSLPQGCQHIRWHGSLQGIPNDIGSPDVLVAEGCCVLMARRYEAKGMRRMFVLTFFHDKTLEIWGDSEKFNQHSSTDNSLWHPVTLSSWITFAIYILLPYISYNMWCRAWIFELFEASWSFSQTKNMYNMLTYVGHMLNQHMSTNEAIPPSFQSFWHGKKIVLRIKVNPLLMLGMTDYV